jgi:hypothetical protein
MSAEEFLSTTPVEINWKIEAYNDLQEEKYLLLKQLAYNIGGCVRHANAEDDYPDFDEIFVENPEEAELMNDEELRAQAKMKNLKSPD